MVFSTFILRYLESKFTLLTYLMANNTVITVISYFTKGLNNSKRNNKSLSLPYITKHSFVDTVMRFSTTDIMNYYFTRKQYECKNVRMQRGFRVKRCSIKLWDLTGNGVLKCKTMPYCNTMRKTQSIIITLSCSVEVSNGVPSDDPFAPIWWTELLFTWHFLFFVHCFVCVTDYRIMF